LQEHIAIENLVIFLLIIGAAVAGSITAFDVINVAKSFLAEPEKPQRAWD
jgi:hypothetical protein